MTSPTTEQALLAGAVVAGAAVLAGCGGGGGGGGAGGGAEGGAGGGGVEPTTVKNTITALTVKAAGTPLTINTIEGGPDGVRFNLGGTTGYILPADPGADGAARTYAFAITPTATPASVETLDVVINPEPGAVIDDLGLDALRSTRDSLARIGFPPTWNELMSHAGMTHDQIVDRALARLGEEPAEAYPAWIDRRIQSWYTLDNTLPHEEVVAISNRNDKERSELKAWWFRQMVTSPDALAERLTLFWHNLFTSSMTSIDWAGLMARQHRMYRRHMTGHFGSFVKAMSRDPGMCEYLDSSLNTARYGAIPNENFARELMELFTFGERTRSHAYVEEDVKALARFFTGYHVDYDNDFAFSFSLVDHDTGDKTLFGQIRTGTNPAGGYEADGDWAIDRILAKVDEDGKSCCARHIVTRLWREFIGTPRESDKAAIQALADGFAANWELLPLYRAFFTSADFASSSRRGTRARSPIELWVGFYRPLERQPGKWDEHESAMASLGQDLFDPPNVFGWPGNEAWISLQSVVARREHLNRMNGSEAVTGIPADMEAAVPLLLMAHDPVDPPYVFPDRRSQERSMRIARFFNDPAYNLG